MPSFLRPPVPLLFNLHGRARTGLRGCMLIELGLRNRVDLEKNAMRKRSLVSRKLLPKDARADRATGDVLLDEAVKCVVRDGQGGKKRL